MRRREKAMHLRFLCYPQILDLVHAVLVPSIEEDLGSVTV
jgi:hypothetical protein